MAKPKTNNTYVYVYVQEHYHFPKDVTEQMGDMVAATPMEVRPKHDIGRVVLVKRAKEAAEKAAKQYSNPSIPEEMGKVMENFNGNEYRVWVDWPIHSWGWTNADRFVYVVRRVIFKDEYGM